MIGDFQLNLEQSTFVDWQRLRVQENADEIPPGVCYLYEPIYINIFLYMFTVYL
jgi:DNA replicative helicase MCM subunit Mcm2 (Cdc46/Mcm family)